MYIKFSPVSRCIDFLPLLHILVDATHLLLSCFQFIDVRSKPQVGLNKEECFFVHHLKLRSVAKMKASCRILLWSIIGQSLRHLRLLFLLLSFLVSYHPDSSSSISIITSRNPLLIFWVLFPFLLLSRPCFLILSMLILFSLSIYLFPTLEPFSSLFHTFFFLWPSYHFI